MLRALRRFRVDVTKLTDEVSHITKCLGTGTWPACTSAPASGSTSTNDEPASNRA